MSYQMQHHQTFKVLGIYAHPDDESFCVGGTLAKYAAAGAETMVVSFTQGEAGQIHDSNVASRHTLGETRANELVNACQRLGVRHVRCLDFGDGRLCDLPQAQLIAEVTRVIREFQPDIVLTFGEDGAYGHPDHIVIGAATDQAFHLASDPTYCSEHFHQGLAPHTPSQLYHSYFPRQNELLLEHLANWLQNMTERFQGSTDYIRGLRVFSNSVSMLGYANDHVEVEWFAPDFSIVEQGEAATSLYLILSGCADVMQEDENGRLTKIASLCEGQYFGETGLATNQPRNAQIIARSGLSCLVFSPEKPANFAGRGANALLGNQQATAERQHSIQTICVDTSEFVMDKVAAIAAHRSQCPISLDMFPKAIWNRLFGKEYFVCRYSASHPSLA